MLTILNSNPSIPISAFVSISGEGDLQELRIVCKNPDHNIKPETMQGEPWNYYRKKIHTIFPAF